MNKSTKQSIVLSVMTMLVVVSIIATQQQAAYAGLLDSYAQGRQDGRDQAKQDFNSNNGPNNNCPQPGIMYCVGFKLAYNSMWNKLLDVNQR
jgi:hypothetical protein